MMLADLGVVDLWVYVLGAFVIVVMPGPNSLYVLKTAVVDGRAPAFAASCAVFAGDSLLMFASYVGVAALIAAHPEIFIWIKTLGAVYLAWIGAKIFWHTFAAGKKETAGSEVNVSNAENGGRKAAVPFSAFRTALILSLTNPKTILFFVAFFVQFIDASFHPTWIPYLTLATILQCFSVMWLMFLSTIGADLLRKLSRFSLAGKLGNTAMGSLFLGFAGKLAFGE